MGTRVRKLARELQRTPAEVLGLLHELGYQRYQSAEDMVNDTAVDRLRQAAGGPGRGAQAPRPAVAREPAPRREARADDLMARLVPGVVRRPQDDERTNRSPAGRSPAPRAVAAPARTNVPAATPAPEAPAPVTSTSELQLEVERARLEAERASMEALRAELTEARASLQRARRELAEARAEVEQMQLHLEEERVALAEARAQLDPSGTPLVELLESRGLRGSDELQRALGMLAGGRHLVGVLSDLRVVDRHRFRRTLEDRLVLVGGEVPEALQGVAAVTVAPERADLPDARELERLMGEVGEQMLLNGLRRLIVVGAAPRWHRLLREGIDRRVELQFRATPARDGDEPGRADAVALWRVDLADEVRRVWLGRMVLVVEGADPSLATFLTAVRDRLRAG